MTKERLIEMIDNVLAWGSDHDEEFRGNLVDALDITEEEYRELFDEDLNEYLGESEDDEDEDLNQYIGSVGTFEPQSLDEDYWGDEEEAEIAKKYDGEEFHIVAVTIDNGNFDDSYFDIQFEDGYVMEGVSSVELEMD